MKDTSKPSKWVDYLVVGLVVAVLGAAMFSGSSGSASQLEGEPAPDFTVTTQGGRELAMSELKGKVVLIDFWATWCPPCRKQMPVLQGLGEELGDAIEIVSINTDDPTPSRPAQVAEFLQRRKLNFDVVLDDGTLMADYKITHFPTMIVVRPDGVVLFADSGFLSLAKLQDLVREAQGSP